MLLLEAEALICPITVVSGSLPSFMLLLLRMSRCEEGSCTLWPYGEVALVQGSAVACVKAGRSDSEGASRCISPVQRGTAYQDTPLVGLVAATQRQCPGQPGQGSTMYWHARLHLHRNITGASSEGSHGALLFFLAYFLLLLFFFFKLTRLFISRHFFLIYFLLTFLPSSSTFL